MIHFISKIKYILIVIMAMTLFIFYFYQGIPGKGHWNPGMRFDISGISLIPETDVLITISDKGPLAGFLSFFAPTMLVVDMDNFLPATRVSLDILINKKIKNIHWGWDAEAIKCITLNEQKIGCALVSGKRNQLIWVEAETLDDAVSGRFSLTKHFFLGKANKTNLTAFIPDDQDIEAIEILNHADNRLSLLMISRLPGFHDGRRVYTQYLSEFNNRSHKLANGENTHLSILGYLPESICNYPMENRKHSARIGGLTRLENSDQAILICTAEEADRSFLTPVIITKTGLKPDLKKAVKVINKNDFDIPPPIVKIEGIVCRKNRVVIAIDADSFGGGIYELDEQFSELCKT